MAPSQEIMERAQGVLPSAGEVCSLYLSNDSLFNAIRLLGEGNLDLEVERDLSSTSFVSLFPF